MKIAIIVDHDNDFRVHAAGCADVAKDERRYHDTAWIIDVPIRAKANRAMWSDIASDAAEPGTDEHTALIASYASSATTYLPCCSDLPDHTDAGTEE